MTDPLLSRWRDDVESAPQDGTIFWATNPVLKIPVLTRRGEFRPSWGGRPVVTWISEFTRTETLPFRRGNMVHFTRWAPATESEIDAGLPASAIEARSDATPKSGAAEGESATAKPGRPNDSRRPHTPEK